MSRTDVTILNHTSHALEDTLVRFGEHVCEFGYVAISGNKGWVGFAHPITSHAELRWKEARSQRVEQIDLSKIYRQGREGELIFEIYEGRVDASFREEN